MLNYRLINRLRSFVWRYPRLYRPIGIARRGLDVADLEYDIFVEGYPRSANTFVSKLLRQTQPKLRVRSHRHLPPHVVSAVLAGKPVLFLIRQPLDCVSSYAIMKNSAATAQLFYYIAYHEALKRYRDRMFVADFASITSDPKSVLSDFAGRFNIPLDLEFDLGYIREEVFREIDFQDTSGSGNVDDRRVCRPIESRRSLKAPLIDELNRPALRPYLDRANQLYSEFTSPASKPRLFQVHA